MLGLSSSCITSISAAISRVNKYTLVFLLSHLFSVLLIFMIDFLLCSFMALPYNVVWVTHACAFDINVSAFSLVAQILLRIAVLHIDIVFFCLVGEGI